MKGVYSFFFIILYEYYEIWSFNISDVSPPSLSCPRQLVTLTQSASEEGKEFTSIDYSPLEVTGVGEVKQNSRLVVSDNNGSFTLTYNPPQGTTVRATEVMNATVVATDSSGNTATCQFFVEVQRKIPILLLFYSSFSSHSFSFSSFTCHFPLILMSILLESFDCVRFWNSIFMFLSMKYFSIIWALSLLLSFCFYSVFYSKGLLWLESSSSSRWPQDL